MFAISMFSILKNNNILIILTNRKKKNSVVYRLSSQNVSQYLVHAENNF